MTPRRHYQFLRFWRIVGGQSYRPLAKYLALSHPAWGFFY